MTNCNIKDILLLILRLKLIRLYINPYLKLLTAPYFLNLLIETAKIHQKALKV